MNEDLSTTEGGALRLRLDEASVLEGTVIQLRKDLNAEAIEIPEVGAEAFERLRGQVEGLINAWSASNVPALSRAINRVDLTERMVSDAMERGGTRELAGDMVLRCLQKVLSRRRFAGLW